jgi:hypothetical protein
MGASPRRTLRQRLLDTDELRQLPEDDPLYRSGPLVILMPKRKAPSNQAKQPQKLSPIQHFLWS